MTVPESGLENRIGSRVLPAWMSLRDDATSKEWNGRALAGFYEADLEGVVPAPVTLVDNGVLKSYLTTRQPVKGGGGSNGHARLPQNLRRDQGLVVGHESARVHHFYCAPPPF